jgi:predicted nucleotidyltransferase
MKTSHDRPAPPVAQEYAKEVRLRLGEQARQVILFGSQARGDAQAGSDYDFIVVVDERTRQLRELLADAGDQLLDRCEALCAATVYDQAQWRLVHDSPLGWNVERDGVLL